MIGREGKEGEEERFRESLRNDGTSTPLRMGGEKGPNGIKAAGPGIVRQPRRRFGKKKGGRGRGGGNSPGIHSFG